jgi:hypothetical protein
MIFVFLASQARIDIHAGRMDRSGKFGAIDRGSEFHVRGNHRAIFAAADQFDGQPVQIGFQLHHFIHRRITPNPMVPRVLIPESEEKRNYSGVDDSIRAWPATSSFRLSRQAIKNKRRRRPMATSVRLT